MAAVRTLQGARRFAALVAGGLVAALALPPLGLWPLAALGFPVLLLVLEGLAGKPRRVAFFCGWAFGFGYFLFAFHWIGAAFFVDAATYLWMMPFAVGGLAAAMAVYWGLAAVVVHAMRFRGVPLAMAFAAVLALAENLRGRLFTGFPWAAPGLVVDGMGPVAQGAALVGMTGFTLLIVVWAGLPVALGRGRREGGLALLFLLLLPALWVYGSVRLAGATAETVPNVKLRLVQPNISQDEKWREENARSNFDQLKRLSAMATPETPTGIGGITHVVWPESAVSFLIDESPMARGELAELLAGKTVLVTGAIRRDTMQLDAAGEPAVHNSMIAFDGTGTVVAHYDKWRLVPGGEFLPFEWLLEPLGFRKVVTVPGSFLAGGGPQTLQLPGAPPVAMMVCYEIAFPHNLLSPTARPGWILNVTNDGWFGRSTGPYQHLAQARLRAIEQGIPVVRAANTGISAVIDAYGRYWAELPLGMAGVVDSALPVALSIPVYGRFGDLMVFGGAIVTFVAAFLLQRHRKTF